MWLLLLYIFNKLQIICVMKHSISCDFVWFKNRNRQFGQFILSTPWGTLMSAPLLYKMLELSHTQSKTCFQSFQRIVVINNNVLQDAW
jgi:hypothetical protein